MRIELQIEKMEVIMTKYYSRSKQKFIDIANMPDQYVRNAFVKMCSTNENSLHEINQDRFELQKQVKHYKKLAEDNFIASVDDLEKNEITVGSLTKERDDYKKKANDMEMAKMNINRELLDVKDKLKDTVSKEVYQAMWINVRNLKKITSMQMIA